MKNWGMYFIFMCLVLSQSSCGQRSLISPLTMPTPTKSLVPSHTSSPFPTRTITLSKTLSPTNTPIPTSTPKINFTTHGIIRWDETWMNEIRIIGDIIVERGYTLTIEPGTIVLIAANQDVDNLFDWWFDMQQGIAPNDDWYAFDHGVHYNEPYRDEGNHVSIRVFGTLHAAGTSEKPIMIRSDSPDPGIYDWNFFDFLGGILS